MSKQVHPSTVSASLLTLALVAVSACGGGSPTSPSAPNTPPPSTTEPTPQPPTPEPTPTPPPAPSITVIFDDGVAPDDRLGIEDGVTIGYAFLQREFQWRLARSITIRGRASAGPGVANAGPDEVNVNAQNENWRITSDAFRRKIMVHELFHVLQYHNGWASSPVWLREGSAEFVGFKAVFVDRRLLDDDGARNCQLAGLFTSSPSIGELRSYENSVGNGNTYTLFYLAAERLTRGKSLSVLATFTSFEATFGTTQSDFYREFEAYRSSIPRGSYSCPGFRR